MSKGNLPQTEAGSSEAVAPGKAELLSFLKCQRGTGTGNTSLCALWFPPQRWQAAVLNKGNKQTTVIYYSETLYMCQESQVYNLPTDFSFSFNIKLFWILIQCGFSSTRSFFFFLLFVFLWQPPLPFLSTRHDLIQNRLNHTDERSVWKEKRNSTQKNRRGSVHLFSHSFTLLSRALYLARSHRENKTHCLYHPKDHRRLFDSAVKSPWSQ